MTVVLEKEGRVMTLPTPGRDRAEHNRQEMAQGYRLICRFSDKRDPVSDEAFRAAMDSLWERLRRLQEAEVKGKR